VRAFIAILLASAFLLQSAGKLLVLANYEINKEYIAKTLCVNKAKPKMHCNGKCHLKKQLEKQEKKENTPANNLKTKIDIQLFSESRSFIESKKTFEIVQHHSHYLFPLYDSPLASIFHPPTI
jgi:hypothetical protein